MVGTIDIKTLNLDELVGVVNLYPWYGGARKELCSRMAAMGGDWGDGQFAAAALYVPSRKMVGDLVRTSGSADYSDKDIQSLLKAYLPEKESPAPESGQQGRRIVVVGGDYFTQDQYERVRRSSDNIFSNFASKARAEGYVEPVDEDFDLCTEALAQIYAEQGYPQEAKKIYSRLAQMDPSRSEYYNSIAEKL